MTNPKPKSERATWALIVARLCSDPIWWFFLFWLAKFLDRTYGLKLTEMSLPLVAIYGLAALGSVAGGWAPRQLLLRGVGLRTARLGTMLICALAVVPVTLAVREVGLWTAVMLIGIAMAAHCAWISNTFALVSDLFPRRSVATVAGLSGMVGSLGGMVMAQVAGQVLESTGSYLPLFLIASASYLCGWIIIRFLLPRLENN
jgi:ACS family hexuronate transporter-like MFS transporter